MRYSDWCNCCYITTGPGSAEMKWVAWLLGLVTLVTLTTPVYSGDEDDSGTDWYSDSMDEWENEVEEQQGFHDEMEKGFKNWEERCLKIGGETVLKRWLQSQEELVQCFMEEFQVFTIQDEIEESKQKGELELVFQKYCRDHVPRARTCLESFLDVSRECLQEKNRPGLNITLQMVDAAIDFTCHNSGDRIILFLAQNGYECVEKHKNELVKCINNSVPELFHMNNHNSEFIVFDEKTCSRGKALMTCVEESLLDGCDPTPSNMVNSMLEAVRQSSPCGGGAAEGWHSASSGAISLGVGCLVALMLVV